jgi:hypothetical protein
LETHVTYVRPLPAHLLAGALTLFYAWLISNTRFVTTGVQFVSPLAVVLLVHLAWLGASRRLGPGFAMIAYRRSLVTAIGIAACTGILAMFAPMPAAATTVSDMAGYFYGALAILACLAVLAVVVAVAAAIVYGVALAARSMFRWLRHRFGPPPGPGGTRFHDVSSIAIVMLAIGATSLEGLAGAVTFAVADGASSSMFVAASPARVWQEVGQATSPAFPLPVMLKSIPQPVAVLVDEGAGLGARRIVRFKGREGEGDLTLQVVRRNDGEAVFQAVSDTSPIAMWVRQKALTFRVEPAGSGSRLTVASDYDRRLSPAWFFRPYIRIASYLAVDVLARDTKIRAERR